MGYKNKFTTPAENAMDRFSGLSGVDCQKCKRGTTNAQFSYSMRFTASHYAELVKALKITGIHEDVLGY